MLTDGGRVCLIGAGSTGIAVCKALADREIPFDCFEKSDRVGGNWVFKNKNGMSSAYRSLHINTSRERMQFADYPMPASYPDFPHHTLIARYFENYVDRFGLRRRITFNTSVQRVTPAPGGYRVRLEDGTERDYSALGVCNGHHWDPLWPDPAFPGEFAGISMHSHHYIDPQEPHDLLGKRVLVLGMGNSAMDIASELCRPGVAKKVYLAARRGAWVVPKYLFGKPLDQVLTVPIPMPRALRLKLGRAMYKLAVGDMVSYGLPQPDHDLGEAHPTISSDILIRLGSGDIEVKPNILRLEAEQVRFSDGSSEFVDAIVYCTGYRVTFPFFDPEFVAAPDNDLPLFRRVFHPEHSGLFFFGLCQPLGAIMPIAEAQGKWVARYLVGEYRLPTKAEMRQDMRREREEMFERYVRSRRHTMQVDFDDYLSDLATEVRRGEKRARRRAG